MSKESETPAWFIEAIKEVPIVKRAIEANPAGKYIIDFCPMCGTVASPYGGGSGGPSVEIADDLHICSGCQTVQYQHPVIYDWIVRVLGFHEMLKHHEDAVNGR